MRLTIIMHNRRCLIAIEIVYYRKQFPNSTCIFAAWLQTQPKIHQNPPQRFSALQTAVQLLCTYFGENLKDSFEMFYIANRCFLAELCDGLVLMWREGVH